MEVVHIVRQYKPSVGGLEDAVENLCAYLSRRSDVKVRIVTLDRVFTNPKKVLQHYEVIDGIPVTRLSYFGSSRYPIAPGILREIASADLVHVHAIDFFFDFLALTRFIHKKPLVVSTHGGFFHSNFAPRLKKFWFENITRLSARAYAALCTSSDNDAATFSRIAEGKIETVENGVNIDKWKGAANSTPQRSMIFIGRWAGNKNVPALIDLIAALKKQGHNWKLIIAGIPGEETLASLQAHAARLNLSQQVSVYEKPTQATIARLIGEASYIASASAYEGFGISIVEGLSAGLIPLVSPIAPFDKLRRELGFGAVIDRDDLAKSAKDIETLHANYVASPESMRTQCMALARRYDWANATKHFLAIYDRVLGRTAITPHETLAEAKE